MYKKSSKSYSNNGHKVLYYGGSKFDARHQLVLWAPANEYGVTYILRARKFESPQGAEQAYQKAVAWINRQSPADWQLGR